MTPVPIDADVYETTLHDLLGEDVSSVERRQLDTFRLRAGDRADAIVLFGAAGLGRRTLAGLRRTGVEPLAFADNNPSLQGTRVDGIPVLRPEEAAVRYGDSACFVATTMRSVVEGRTLAGMRAQLARSAACSTIPAGVLFWAYPDVFLPYFFVERPSLVMEQRDSVIRAFDLWADDVSRRRYVALVKARLTLALDSEIDVEEAEAYFVPGRYAPRSDEHYVDCGAYDGDVIRRYISAVGPRFGAITAFEPDASNYARLVEHVASLPPNIRRRIATVRAAVGAHSGTVRFSADLLEQSRVSAEGDRQVPCIALDDRDGPPPTLVKLDVEGEEPNALLGMRRLISEHRPVLAVSVYHTLDHVWSLPLLIDSIVERYRFHLACHGMASWDTICYAIPEERAVS